MSCTAPEFSKGNLDLSQRHPRAASVPLTHMAKGGHGCWNEIFTSIHHSQGLEGSLRREWSNGSALGAPSLHLEKSPCPGKVLPGPPAPEAAEPKAPALQLCPPQLSLPPSHLSKAWSRFWNTRRSPLGAFPHPPVATAPSQPRRAHAPHTHRHPILIYTGHSQEEALNTSFK